MGINIIIESENLAGSEVLVGSVINVLDIRQPQCERSRPELS